MSDRYVSAAGLASGTVLAGRFRIKECVGKGGMGRVYRAIQMSVDREVALKTLLHDPLLDPEGRERWLQRFRKEAHILSRLNHPNTVSIIDYGETREGVCFLAMEYLRGVTLAEVLKDEGALPSGRVIHIVRQVCRSLSDAHAAGVVHRDLKPANIFLTRLEDDEWVKVMDFGIAQLGEGDTDESVTQTGTVMGSPAYMAPEQASGRVVGPHTDIYALGVIMYQMLSGREPFEGDSSMEVMVKHIHDPVPQLVASSLPLHPPEILVDLVHKCLEKRPEKRPVSAGEILDWLDAIEGHGPKVLETSLAAAAMESTAQDLTGESVAVALTGRKTTRTYRTLARKNPYAWVASLVISLVALGLLVAPVHFFAGGVVVEAIIHQSTSAATAGEAIKKWDSGRGVVAILFTQDDACGLAEKFALGLQERLEEHTEECEQLRLESLLSNLDGVCEDPVKRARVRYLSARLVSSCQCRAMNVLEQYSEEYIEARELRSSLDVAGVFEAVGSCAYVKVFRRDYQGSEEKTALLLKALTWSQNALVSLTRLDDTGSEAIVLKLEALNNAANALKLLKRHVEAEERLREAIEFAQTHNDRFYRREYYRMLAPLHFNLGLLLTDYGEEGEYQEALTQLRTAERFFSLRMGRENSAHLDKVRTQLGILYCRFGQVSQASDLLDRTTASRWERFEEAPIIEVDQRRAEYYSSLSYLAWALAQCALSKTLCKGGGREGLGKLRGWFDRVSPMDYDEPSVAGSYHAALASVCLMLSEPECADRNFQESVERFAMEGASKGQAAEFVELYRRVHASRRQVDPSELLYISARSVEYLAEHIDELALSGTGPARLKRLRDDLSVRWRYLSRLCAENEIRQVCRSLESPVAAALSGR